MAALLEHKQVLSRYARFKLWLKKRRLSLAVGFFLALWMLAYWFPSIAISVDPGHAGVLWRWLGKGTVTERSYGEGLTVIWPWNRMYVYDLRFQQITHGVDVLSRDGLPYHIDATVRFRIRPNRVALLHQSVGPDYVDKLILPVVASRIRNEVAKYHSEEVYGSRRLDLEASLGEELSHPAPAMPGPYAYLEISDVFIRNIVLPPVIAQAIEAKLVQEQQMLEYRYRLEKEEQEKQRKQIEAEGIRQFQEAFNKGVSDGYLKWQGINATLELAKSANAKIVIIGHESGGLPIIFGDGTAVPAKPDPANGPTAADKDAPAPRPSPR
jgi:regulator of protease activity HflC (stomatin/prohibitin superfamily)